MNGHKKEKKNVCNMNCFECIHPDCINNGNETKQEKEWTSARVEPWRKKLHVVS